MTLLEAVERSILAHLRLHVDSAANRVVNFYESYGTVVILYSHTGPTRELKSHTFHGGIHNMLHLVDLDLTGES